MSAPPYRTVAVASTFSPRFMHVLAEAKRVRERLGQQLDLIYVGEQSEETVAKFRDAFARLGLPENSKIHYESGDPAAAVLRVGEQNEVDLIVAGALEKEVVLRPFLGNVARRLVRDARCSVMLFTKPEEQPLPFRRIVFIADYSEHGRAALEKTFHLAAAEQCDRLYVVRIYTSFDEARARGEPGAVRTFDEEEHALEEFVDDAGHTEVPIEARCIRGNTGYAALDFVQSIEANLLVVPVDPQLPAGELPAQVAWITETIPCNLWVVR